MIVTNAQRLHICKCCKCDSLASFVFGIQYSGDALRS